MEKFELGSVYEYYNSVLGGSSAFCNSCKSQLSVLTVTNQIIGSTSEE